MATQKEIDAYNDLCRSLQALYPHGLPKNVKAMVDDRYIALYAGATGDQLDNREVPVAQLTYNIDITRNREGNAMVRVTVCDRGDIIETEDFYSVDNADEWLHTTYPSAEKE